MYISALVQKGQADAFPEKAEAVIQQVIRFFAVLGYCRGQWWENGVYLSIFMFLFSTCKNCRVQMPRGAKVAKIILHEAAQI